MFKSSVYILLLILTGLTLAVATTLIPLAFTETVENSTEDKLQRSHTATLDRVRLRSFETLQKARNIAKRTDLVRAFSPPAVRVEPTATEPNLTKRYPARNAQLVEDIHAKLYASTPNADLLIFVDEKGHIIASKTPKKLEETLKPTTDIHGIAALRETLTGVSRDGIWNPTPKSPPYIIATSPIVAARDGEWKLVGAVLLGEEVDSNFTNAIGSALNPNNNTDAFLNVSIIQHGRLISSSATNTKTRDLISTNAALHSARDKVLLSLDKGGHINTATTENSDSVRMFTSALVSGEEGKNLGLVTTIVRKPVTTDPIQLVTQAIALTDTRQMTGDLWLFLAIAFMIFLLGLLIVNNEITRPAIILRRQLEEIEQKGQENLDLNPDVFSGTYRDVATRINKIFNILRKRLERGRSTQSKLMAIPIPTDAKSSGSFSAVPQNPDAPNIAPPTIEPNPSLAQTNTAPTNLKPLPTTSPKSAPKEPQTWSESPAPIPAAPVSRNVRNIETAAAELMRRLSENGTSEKSDPALPLPEEDGLSALPKQPEQNSENLGFAPTSNIDLNDPLLNEIEQEKELLEAHPATSPATPPENESSALPLMETIDVEQAEELQGALEDPHEEFPEIPQTRQLRQSSSRRPMRNPNSPPGFNNETPEELPPTPVPEEFDSAFHDSSSEQYSKDSTADLPADQMSDLFRRLVDNTSEDAADTTASNPLASADLDAPFDREETRAMTHSTAEDLLESTREPDLSQSAIAASTQIKAKSEDPVEDTPSSLSPHSLLEALKQRGAVPTPPPQAARRSREEKTQVKPVSNSDLRKSIPPGEQPKLGAEINAIATLYEEFMDLKRQCGENDNLPIDKFAQKVNKNRQKLIQKLNCKDVKFTVYVKNGKAALKASPVK